MHLCDVESLSLISIELTKISQKRSNGTKTEEKLLFIE